MVDRVPPGVAIADAFPAEVFTPSMMAWMNPGILAFPATASVLLAMAGLWVIGAAMEGGGIRRNP